ncbi:helix-turn-helix domain-containing protein [Cupriavidus necator]|uniref:helix-turn-helix domain-containing protein n=1 Tax=Cupriavidus necator TaxID=106590 RepID=UPI0018AF8ECC|nr:LysR family transcriptional regulator [Cupriavidus necator]
MTTILEETSGLVAFVRTAEEGSFSAASRALGASQSAVSKSVARPESRLGVHLFQRSTHTLSLTAEGQASLDRGEHECPPCHPQARPLSKSKRL